MNPFSWLFFRITGGIYRLASPGGAALSRAFRPLKRLHKRMTYDLLSNRLSALKVNGVRLMNYGYAEPNGRPLETALDEADRNEYPFSWALVDKTVRPGQVAGRRVLVAGCGRGGDAYYIRRYLQAAEVMGIDASGANIAACRKSCALSGLSFEVGDAEQLRFPDGTWGSVVSIESSHGYGNPSAFYREAARVLQPGGALLYCDYFWESDAGRRLESSGLQVEEEENLTEGVLRACREGAPMREEMIARWAAPSLRPMLREWCALPGSTLYRAFERGACRYLRFLARKKVPN